MRMHVVVAPIANVTVVLALAVYVPLNMAAVILSVKLT